MKIMMHWRNAENPPSNSEMWLTTIVTFFNISQVVTVVIGLGTVIDWLQIFSGHNLLPKVKL